ncbi:hypothetical protein [Beijerinckia indica]|uniref:hypothetical protein n=1 Tax=Beijerinckia indica TaxID=533 RepID=UPI0003141F11|nr:hypothetical protein [Beijerinckia indica]
MPWQFTTTLPEPAAPVAHHLIAFARDACAGKNNASHYSAKARTLELEGQIGS